MILKITSDLNPENLIVCFDRAAPTFRKQLYVGYQATRPKMEDDLSNQFVIIHEVLEKIGICVFELDGYEADDLIGTLSRQAIENKEFDQVIILTGDRDMLQLVNHQVLVLAPIVGVTKMVLFDEHNVKEKYGLEPHQFIDYKALVGDASDNYPGVNGIGPKGAANLLNQYHTLEGIYANLGEIKPGVAEKLAQDAEQSALAKKLATIELHAPIKLDPNICTLSKMDRKALLKEFEDLQFHSLITRFRLDKKPAVADAKAEEPADKKNNEEQLGLLS
jgi:DNA polymerase-1